MFVDKENLLVVNWNRSIGVVQIDWGTLNVEGDFCNNMFDWLDFAPKKVSWIFVWSTAISCLLGNYIMYKEGEKWLLVNCAWFLIKRIAFTDTFVNPGNCCVNTLFWFGDVNNMLKDRIVMNYAEYELWLDCIVMISPTFFVRSFSCRRDFHKIN